MFVYCDGVLVYLREESIHLIPSLLKAEVEPADSTEQIKMVYFHSLNH